MKKVTIQFGIDEITRSVPESTTVGQLIGDNNVKAVLGFGDNVRVLQNGVELPVDAITVGDSKLIVETRCNSKATSVVL